MKTIYAIQVTHLQRKSEKDPWVITESNVSQETYETERDAIEFIRERGNTTVNPWLTWMPEPHYEKTRGIQYEIKPLTIKEGHNER